MSAAENIPFELRALGAEMDGFAGVADEILEDAAPSDYDHVWSRLQCVLREAGLLPGDDEPCSE